ncbi:MAG: type II toxin-antitoxin system Phd/YefM family antitoxin [Patescibacteria group bacterium]
MLDVDVEKILPVTEARDSLNKIIDEVEDSEQLYVITKNGKPAAIIVGVHHLEKLTGIPHTDLIVDEGNADQIAEANAGQPATPPALESAPTATWDQPTGSAVPSDPFAASSPDLNADIFGPAEINTPAPVATAVTDTSLPLDRPAAAPAPVAPNQDSANTGIAFGQADSSPFSFSSAGSGAGTPPAQTPVTSAPVDNTQSQTADINPSAINQSQVQPTSSQIQDNQSQAGSTPTNTTSDDTADDTATPASTSL